MTYRISFKNKESEIIDDVEGFTILGSQVLIRLDGADDRILSDVWDITPLFYNEG